MKLKTTFGISLILVILAAAGYFLIVQAPSAAARQVAEQIRAEFAKAFQFEPEIQIRSRTYLGQTRAILELATARKEIRERHRLEHEWLGSVKVFELEGRFLARAGFDLAEPIAIQVDESQKEIRVRLPAARLLGLELAGIRVLADEDGWWNKLTAKDREIALADLQTEARRKISETALTAEATRNFETLTREIFSRAAPGYRVIPNPESPSRD